MSHEFDADEAFWEEAMRESQRKLRPDRDIIPYCDEHIAVAMTPSVTHGMVEYPAPGAAGSAMDVNPIWVWRCPKTECDRCYEPKGIGYCDFPARMGSRINPDSKRHERCSRHDVPFYIGKVGVDDRQYFCPNYKCDQKGEIVASAVTDEIVEIPPSPLDGLKKHEKKPARELAVFTSFASVAGIGIEPGSPENRREPYPDIRCKISGMYYGFELGEIISQVVAAKVNPKRKVLEPGFTVSQEGILQTLLASKKSKKYDSQGDPIDLLIHFDLRYGSRHVVESQIEKYADDLTAAATEGPFERIWIFDDYTKTVVYPLASELTPPTL